MVSDDTASCIRFQSTVRSNYPRARLYGAEEPQRNVRPRDSLPSPTFLVAQEILPQLTRTGLSRQLNTNVGDILSSCIPYTLDNDIKLGCVPLC